MRSQKTALITGAGAGIGRACAVRLAENGYAVVLCGRNVDSLRETEMLCPKSAQVLVSPADVTIDADVERLVTCTVEKFGRLDIVFNNAGVSPPAVPFEDTDIENFKQVVDVNLTGMFLVARAAYRQMKAQSPQGGRIINNGSIAAFTPRPSSVAYTMTKHAVSGLTKIISIEGRAHNIACGQIDIGNTATDMTASMGKGMLQANGEYVPEPTFDVSHVADALEYMSGLPLNANVQSMTVMASGMPYIGRG